MVVDPGEYEDMPEEEEEMPAALMSDSPEGIITPNNVVGGDLGMVVDPGDLRSGEEEEEEMPQGVRMAAPSPGDRQEQPEEEEPMPDAARPTIASSDDEILETKTVNAPSALIDDPDDDLLLTDVSGGSVADQLRANTTEAADLPDVGADLDDLDDLDLD